MVVLMAEPRITRLSVVDKSELWRLWRSGQTLSEIAVALGRPPATVFNVLKINGGYSPRHRHRSSLALSLDEREEISRGLVSGATVRQIAMLIGRSPSTVSREIMRNGGRIRYRATNADEQAWSRARRPQSCKLVSQHRLRRLVARKLSQDWSPEQISGWLQREFPDNEMLQVSHETIYRSLFVQARGVLKKELLGHLRSRRKFRHAKHVDRKRGPRGQIVDAISIRERPPEIEDRAVPGHWEGDLISGSNNTHIATLVERQSRFTMLVRVGGKDTVSVVTALSKQICKLPAELRQTLTWDRGMELAQHKDFSIATNVQVYFCDPSSPWQRGSNENTNGLLRQYFPKSTDLSGYSQAQLNKIALRLNQRPRKTLAYQTPADKLKDVLQ